MHWADLENQCQTPRPPQTTLASHLIAASASTTSTNRALPQSTQAGTRCRSCLRKKTYFRPCRRVRASKRYRDSAPTVTWQWRRSLVARAVRLWASLFCGPCWCSPLPQRWSLPGGILRSFSSKPRWCRSCNRIWLPLLRSQSLRRSRSWHRRWRLPSPSSLSLRYQRATSNYRQRNRRAKANHCRARSLRCASQRPLRRRSFQPQATTGRVKPCPRPTTRIEVGGAATAATGE